MSLIPWRGKQRAWEVGESSSLLSLRQEMDRLFDTFVRTPFGALDWPFAGQRPFSPAIDLAETEEEVIVRAEVPGMDPSEVEVTIVGNELVLAGEKKETKENEGKDFFQSESRYGAFRRSFVLPAAVDTENVAAQCANGVLTLRLKKTRPTPPKRIEVKPGN